MNIDPQYQELRTDGLIENKDTPFYCKNVAIIGYLDNFDSDDKIEELAFLLWVHGATVSSHVTLSTDIVINGIGADEEDRYLISQLKNNGADLIVYYQEDFECMLSEHHLLDWYSGGTSITEEEQSSIEYSESLSFVAVDFEKLNDSRLSVCEVGLVEYEGGEEIRHFHSYINPVAGLKRNDWAIRNLCHITDDMLSEAPTYDKVFPKLQEILRDNILVSHSKGADLNYIYNLEEHFNLPKLYSKWIDTQEIARNLKLKENIPDLYFKLFGKTFTDHHKALDDARACGQILERLSSQVDIRNFIHEEDYLPVDKKQRYGDSNTRHTQYGTANVAPDGLVFNHDKISDISFFKGKAIALSGMSGNKKSEIKSILESLGAKCTSDPSGKTEVFIINQNAVGPSKRVKAIGYQQTNELLVITDDYFWELVNGI